MLALFPKAQSFSHHASRLIPAYICTQSRAEKCFTSASTWEKYARTRRNFAASSVDPFVRLRFVDHRCLGVELAILDPKLVSTLGGTGFLRQSADTKRHLHGRLDDSPVRATTLQYMLRRCLTVFVEIHTRSSLHAPYLTLVAMLEQRVVRPDAGSLNRFPPVSPRCG
jgi:hypothetical protein